MSERGRAKKKSRSVRLFQVCFNSAEVNLHTHSIHYEGQKNNI